MNKLMKDGKVAVLISVDYGAGWSTWNHDFADILLFDSKIVQAVLDEKPVEEIMSIARKQCGITDEMAEEVADIYGGGAHELVVKWIDIGTRFKINEYDGWESICMVDETWKTA